MSLYALKSLQEQHIESNEAGHWTDSVLTLRNLPVDIPLSQIKELLYRSTRLTSRQGNIPNMDSCRVPTVGGMSRQTGRHCCWAGVSTLQVDRQLVLVIETDRQQGILDRQPSRSTYIMNYLLNKILIPIKRDLF